jgi:hypothetical protein
VPLPLHHQRDGVSVALRSPGCGRLLVWGSARARPARGRPAAARRTLYRRGSPIEGATDPAAAKVARYGEFMRAVDVDLSAEACSTRQRRPDQPKSGQSPRQHRPPTVTSVMPWTPTWPRLSGGSCFSCSQRFATTVATSCDSSTATSMSTAPPGRCGTASRSPRQPVVARSRSSLRTSSPGGSAPDAVLVTYVSVSEGRRALRSSTWIRRRGVAAAVPPRNRDHCIRARTVSPWC